MSKDTQLLARVSKKFTEETVKTILQNATGEKSATVSDWKFESAANKGDNYLSIVYRAKIQGIVDDKEIEVCVIIKGLPNNPASKKTFRSSEFFENEIYFYNNVVPMFEKFLNSKGHQDLLPTPKCLATLCDGENDFIVLEDITTYGYKHIGRQDAWSVDECQLVLKGLARYHAISAACKSECPSEYTRVSKGLKEILFAEKYWDWYKKYYTITVDIAKDAVMREYKDTKEAKKFIALSAKDLYDKEVNCCSRCDAATSIINHGDSWATNFMVRMNEDKENDVMILDYQLSRVASPVLDISFLIYTTTDEECREKYFTKLLDYYHGEFTKVIDILGTDMNKIYPWSVFMKDVQEQFVHGFCFSLEQLPSSLLDESEAFEVENITGDEAVDIADVWKLNPTIENQARRKRIADVVVHAVRQGFI